MECDLCVDEFVVKELLLEHMAALHPLKCKPLKKVIRKYFGGKIKRRSPMLPNKSVQCDQCGLIAKSSSSLQRHMNAKHIDAIHLNKEPEALANKIVNDFENSLNPGGERPRKRAIQLLMETNSYMKQGSVEPFSANDLKDLILQTGLSKKKTITLMMKLKSKWGVEIAETDFRQKLDEVCTENIHIKDRSHTFNQQIKPKTGKEKNCKLCEKLFSCGFTLSRHMRTHMGKKSYPCSKCDLSFHLFGLLKKHQTIHIDEKLLLVEQKG